MEQLLAGLYNNPARQTGFAGSRKLKAKVGPKNSRAVDEWLRGQPAYTLHRQAPTKFWRRKTLVNGPRVQVQVDLVDVQRLAGENDGVKHLMTAVDAFSRLARVFALKTKTGAEVARAMSLLLEETPYRLVQTDKGKEFYNVNVRRVLDNSGSKHFSTENETIKASIVERFNRTLKECVYRYMTYADSERFIDVLPELVDSYNNTPHGETGLAPNDVDDTNKEEVWFRLYEDRKTQKRKLPRLAVGDYVRVSKARGAFERGYTANWTEEVFVVSRVLGHVRPVVYKVEDLDGEEVRGTFYEQELQRVDKPDTFRVEKVIRTRKSGVRKEALVKWLGYPEKFNSWISWPQDSHDRGKRRR